MQRLSAVRPCAVYFMGNGSPDEAKLFPTGEKVDIQAFFYFFLRHSKKFGDLFTKSVGFLFKKLAKSLEKTRISKATASRKIFISLFFSSDCSGFPSSKGQTEYFAVEVYLFSMTIQMDR